MVDGHEMVTEARQAVKDLVAQSRAAQGLPPTVEDPYVLALVAGFLDGRAAVPPLASLQPPKRAEEVIRPARRMPTTRRIAEHWDMPDRVCWRCDRVGSVERAHIVDRMDWAHGAGLDGAQNLALLCEPCHKAMPIVKPEDWEVGLRYVGLHAEGRTSA